MFRLSLDSSTPLGAPKKARALACGKKLAAALSWLPLAASAWLLARAAAIIMLPAVLPATPPVSAVSGSQAPEHGAAMPPIHRFAVLESNNLFALKSRAPVVAPSAPPPPPPPPALNAFLMGTIEAPQPENARAIIQHEGTQYVLRPGQSIAGFTLKEIKRGKVLFDSGGRMAELKVPDSDLMRGAIGQQTPNSQTVAALPATANAQPGTAQPTQNNTPPTQNTAPQSVTAGSAKAAPHARAVPMAAAAMAAPEVRGMVKKGILTPTQDKSGLVVRQTPNNVLLKALNLQKGDVLTQVNGKPASIMTDGNKLMREIETGSVTVNITRGGRAETVTLRISGSK